MICDCSGQNCSESIFLQQLKKVQLNESFLSCFLDDILFWENGTTDLWGSKKRRKPFDKILDERANATNGRKTIYGDEIDQTTRMALRNSYWKTANDPRTGRPYYYHSKTRVTQWEKPAEIKALEKKMRKEKKKQDAKFFEEMEQNINRSIGMGELIPGIGFEETNKNTTRSETEILSQRKHVRTISTMDGSISFDDLGEDRGISTQTTSLIAPPRFDHSGKPPLPKIPMVGKKMERLPEEEKPDVVKHTQIPPSRVDSGVSFAGETLIDAPLPSANDVLGLDVPSRLRPQAHVRRNTGGTIFLENTMTKPDIHATIKCVCGVYRAHILQGMDQGTRARQHEPHFNADIFLDHRIPQSQRKPQQTRRAPTLMDVLAFYKEFYVRSKMEHDTIIMSLIYVERLVKATDGELNPNPDNWRSILFACMVLASKVWDDLSMWNVDFSNVSTNTNGLFPFSLQRINELELHLLKNLKFDVRVGASEYAKYYFLIRSMLIRSGLVQGSERPLRKTEAFQKLEAKTNTYQAHQLDTGEQKDRRSKSMDDNFWRWIATDRQRAGPVFSDSVCLEQIIGSNR